MNPDVKAVQEKMKILIILGEDERFYSTDDNGKYFYLLGETAQIFASCGLKRFDPIYEENDIPYLVKLDETLIRLLECQHDQTLFLNLIAKNSGNIYKLKKRYNSFNDNMLTIFLATKNEFEISDNLSNTFLTNVWRVFPKTGIIIGSVGQSLLRRNNVIIVMDAAGKIYGIDTSGSGMSPCVQICANFSVFLRQGIISCYRTYRFRSEPNVFEIGIDRNIEPLCPHMLNMNRSLYAPLYTSSDEDD